MPLSKSNPDSPDENIDLGVWRERALALEGDVNDVIIGQAPLIRKLCIAVFSRGHVLLEGDVGVGKTTLLRAIARGIGGEYERIEGTVDLMPSDLVYYTYVDRDGKPRVERGPLLKRGESLSVFFFNEINRARPQVHSLMLRVMAERSVSAFNQEFELPHIQVFADRNRVERDETYEIPPAARDRFLMELTVEMPADTALLRSLVLQTRFHDTDSLIENVRSDILSFARLNEVAHKIQTTVQASDAIADYVLDLCSATRTPSQFGIELEGVAIPELVRAGISPRGMSMILRAAKVAAWLDEREIVVPEDVCSIFPACAAHRVFLMPVYELRRGHIMDEFIERVLNRVAAP